MVYPFRRYALEDNESVDFSFINAPITVDCLRLRRMLDAMDKALKAGMDHEELKCCGRYLDQHYQVNDSEWARIQLKIMSPILGKYITFDYYLNDWHLYLQVEIAKLLLLRNGENR